MEMENFTRTDLKALFDFRTFLKKQLPVINEQIEAKAACPVTFARTIAGYLAALLPLAAALITVNNAAQKKWAKHLLTAISFATASIERHFQTFHIPLKMWDILPPGTEDMVISLGAILNVPPRDSAYTTWLWPSDKFRLDTTPAWLLFKKGVVVYNNMCLDNNMLLRPLISGAIPLASTDAIAHYAAAKKNVDAIFAVWKTFMEKDASGLPNITPEYFMYVFRTYFVNYTIGGEVTTGSNAANIASGISFDAILGTPDDTYRAIIAEMRLQHFTSEDAQMVKADCANRSLLDMYLGELGLNMGMLAHMYMDDLKKVAQQPSSEVVKSFDAYYELVSRWGDLFSMHYGMISNYLIKPAAKYGKICPLGFNPPAVDPTMGTGEMYHEVTKQLAEIRRNNKYVKMVKQLINQENA
jgi:hypothetical protein